jgi:formylglycine-generating enzyme required for sulfatase activity
LVDIPAGTFLMGAPPSEAERFVWDGPRPRWRSRTLSRWGSSSSPKRNTRP